MRLKNSCVVTNCGVIEVTFDLWVMVQLPIKLETMLKVRKTRKKRIISE